LLIAIVALLANKHIRKIGRALGSACRCSSTIGLTQQWNGVGRTMKRAKGSDRP